jgi:enoyl-CoA hydratase/carnithine racemase
LSAQTATRTGLVTEIVPDDQLRSRAGELAAEIADRRPQVIEGTARAMWEARELPHTTAAPHGLSYIPHRQRRRWSARLTHQQDAPRIR